MVITLTLALKLIYQYKMTLTLIAAVAENRVIGYQGKLPWDPNDYPGDLLRFRKLTMGHPIIMGRKTYESIPEKFRPLPGRTNIVVSKTMPETEGIIVCSDIGTTLSHAQRLDSQVFGIGGQRIYEELMPLANRLEITKIFRRVENADTFFPEIDENIWERVRRLDRGSYCFDTYERR